MMHWLIFALGLLLGGIGVFVAYVFHLLPPF